MGAIPVVSFPIKPEIWQADRLNKMFECKISDIDKNIPDYRAGYAISMRDGKV